MTTTRFQLSDKRGDAILLATAEGDDPNETYQAFAAAVQDAGLDGALSGFGQGLVQAVVNASPLTQAMAAEPEPWGNPPVPAYQPPVPAAVYQQPAQAAPAAPMCQHGPKSFQSGVSAKGPWSFWGCNAKSEDPTKCAKEWIR